jgi:hypothetical protein
VGLGNQGQVLVTAKNADLGYFGSTSCHAAVMPGVWRVLLCMFSTMTMTLCLPQWLQLLLYIPNMPKPNQNNSINSPNPIH